ncbi:MAG: TraB/GumN family protein [Bacteroidota bacterium]
MKHLICLLVMFGTSLGCFSQSGTTQSPKGLLWQITGNGLSKPSYLYGTMHVSSKVAFHLNDSFFIALKQADAIGLETNPGNWFEEMLRSKYYRPSYLFDFYDRSVSQFDDVTFRINIPNGLLMNALSRAPGLTNGFLYRHSDSRSTDFEEDTYLDLYIYQAARKLGKQVISVEDFEESERLVMLARESQQNDVKTYNRHRHAFTGGQTIESVYRNGDLDMLDSLNRLNGNAEGWYENMLYKRNYNMALCMDSTMKTRSLFVGVGASHLPGKKGMISMLREMGYDVRPVAHGGKNSKQKDLIDRLNADIVYTTTESADGVFKVSAPGSLFTFPKEGLTQKYLYQDMANGSYYLVTRIKTYAALFGQGIDYTQKRLDSLLYENVPGKIVDYKEILVNGHKACDILNLTQRGHFQRHKIIILPNEIIFFRMHGLNDYVKKNGQPFFNSIEIKQPENRPFVLNADRYGFQVSFPIMPLSNTDKSTPLQIPSGRKEWVATDPVTGTSFLLLSSTSNNGEYLEEDSFELELLSEGMIMNMQGIPLSKHFTYKPNQSELHLTITCKDSSLMQMRLITHMNKAYLLAVKNGTARQAETFFDSFKLFPVQWQNATTYKDTAMYFSVQTFAEPNKPERLYYRNSLNPGRALSKSTTFTDKQTGDEVLVSFYRFPKYENEGDSSEYWKWKTFELSKNEDYVIRKRSGSTLNGMQIVELILGDTGSNRAIRYKLILRHGVLYTLSSISDTSGKTSVFANTIFTSFTPNDTLIGLSPLTDKTCQYLDDLLSTDSATSAQAAAAINDVSLDADNGAPIMDAINRLPLVNNYDHLKKELIKELTYSKDPAVVPFLKNLYQVSADSADLQISALYTLSRIPGAQAYDTWKQLLLHSAPETDEEYTIETIFNGIGYRDSFCFSRTIFPDLLLLLSNQEYKAGVYNLLAQQLDSGTITSAIYKTSIDILLTDARKAMRKYTTSEKNEYSYSYYSRSENKQLKTLNRLLIPFYDDPRVQQHFCKLLTVKNVTFKIETACLLLKYHKNVHDSIFSNLAVKNEHRQLVYESLKKINRLDKFPVSEQGKEKRLCGFIYDCLKARSTTPDTIIVLSESRTAYRETLCTIYLFRFKEKKDLIWQIGITGTICEDTCLSKTNRNMTAISKKLYADNLNAVTLVNEELRSLRLSNRKKSYSYSYDDYDD